MLNPLKEKHHGLYWTLAFAAAKESVSIKRKVGAVIVTPQGMISVGWNGTPPGMRNACENKVLGHVGEIKLITCPNVIHAERNAIDKMTRQGVPVEGSILFVTYAPCYTCALSIQGLGLAAVYYAEAKHTEGLYLLQECGIKTQLCSVN
jgi:dCMP deaminase